MDGINEKIIVVLATAVGGLVGWFLKQWRTGVEIQRINADKEKLVQEKIKYAGENLKQLQEKRRCYNDACEVCKQIALKVIDGLKQETNLAKRNREQFCTVLHNKVIPAYVELIEWEQLACRDNPERLRSLVGEEVVAEIRRHAGWIRVINNKKFIENMGLSAAKISKRTLKPFLLLIKDLPEKENEAVASLLRTAIDELISTGLTGGGV